MLLSKLKLFLPIVQFKCPININIIKILRYDAPSKQSRIDYYGDMVKTYQLGDTGYGTSLKIAPITTETEENTITCLQVNGTQENKIVPQAILPSLEGFECVGKYHGMTDSTEIYTKTIHLYFLLLIFFQF